jgi:hypothetical protein
MPESCPPSDNGPVEQKCAAHRLRWYATVDGFRMGLWIASLVRVVASCGMCAATTRPSRVSSSTNAVESMTSISRHRARNVKRWRDGQVALRSCAAGMVEAGKQFRRVNGHLHLPALRTALARHVGAETLTTECNDHQSNAA